MLTKPRFFIICQRACTNSFPFNTLFICVCVCLLQYQSMRLSDVHRKAQLWRGIVSISLIEGCGLQPMDANGLSDPYVKFRMGHQKYKSKVPRPGSWLLSSSSASLKCDSTQTYCKALRSNLIQAKSWIYINSTNNNRVVSLNLEFVGSIESNAFLVCFFLAMLSLSDHSQNTEPPVEGAVWLPPLRGAGRLCGHHGVGQRCRQEGRLHGKVRRSGLYTSSLPGSCASDCCGVCVCVYRRCTIDLSLLSKEQTHKLDVPLEEGRGVLVLLVTLTASAAVSISDLSVNMLDDPHERHQIMQRYVSLWSWGVLVCVPASALSKFFFVKKLVLPKLQAGMSSIFSVIMLMMERCKKIFFEYQR